MTGSVPGERVEAFETRALGSPLRLHVRAGPGAAEAAWEAVLDEFEAVDVALSRFREDSELTALNRLAGSGRVADVSWRLREAVATMSRASRVTGGRFDPTFARELEELGERGASLTEATEARQASDGGGRIGVLRGLDRPRPIAVPPVPLDTGGIGKGLALRWAARRAMAALAITDGLLLEAGGDIVAAGTAPDGGWRVGIEDPVGSGARSDEPVAVVGMAQGALATSSVRVRRWAGPDGEAVHHLLDPRTRRPARTGLLAVTVAGPDPAWAEVWTKALFLAGRAAIGDEARARGMAAWWVTDDGRLGLTPAAREQSIWVAEARLG